MKVKLLSCTAIALLAFPFAAHADNTKTVKAGTNTEAVSAVEDSLGAAVGVISAEMTSTSKGFVEAASQSSMYEIEAAKIALQRSQSAKIKSFAQEMIDAHTANSNELKSLLQASNLKITPPNKLDDRHKSLIDNLNGAKAEDFDVRYLNQQVNAHQEAVVLMRGFAKDGDNAVLKQFAAKTRPTVEKHLNHAKNLDKQDEDLKAASKQ